MISGIGESNLNLVGDGEFMVGIELRSQMLYRKVDIISVDKVYPGINYIGKCKLYSFASYPDG
jgi:hypothetical protein